MTLASQSSSQPRPAICFVYYGHFRLVVVAAAVSVIIVSCLCLVFCLRFRFTHTFCFVRHFLVLVVFSPCISRSLSSSHSVSVYVCLPSCFSTRFLLFIFTYIFFSSSSSSSLSLSSSFYALSCGLQILEILFFIFFSLPYTLFQREKRVFPDVDFACILLLACLQLGMRVPLEFVEKSNENKRRAALSHILICLSLSLSFVDSICVDDIVKVVYECKREGERNYVVVCSCFSGKTRQALNNKNNNYKALNVQ